MYGKDELPECDACSRSIDIIYNRERVFYKEGYSLCVDCYHKTVCPECGPLKIGEITIGIEQK